jgi:hypothetical protein
VPDSILVTDEAWAPLFETPITMNTAGNWLSGLGYNNAAPADVLISLFDHDQYYFLSRKNLPSEVFDAAIAYPERRVWQRAAETGNLSAEQWDRLLGGLPASPRREALAELAQEMLFGPSWPGPPPATPDEIAAMAADVPEPDLSLHTYELWWVKALHHDADAMRQLAASPNVTVRRSVARAGHLPPDVLDLLARDDDRVVRLFLAESNPDAPPEMLLSLWSWWSGSFSRPGIPRNHPNFPRHGLLRFADDPDPRMRRLALDDPDSTADLVERFSRDPDPGVRGDAAADPRLSPESAVRLAEDADRDDVCWQVWRNPALPTDALVALLLREDTGPMGTGNPSRAHNAAQNPAIPPEIMRRMIRRAAETVASGEAVASGETVAAGGTVASGETTSKATPTPK